MCMSRPRGIDYPEPLYHIISRGNARHEIYREDNDRQPFLSILAFVAGRYSSVCHAYSLLSNFLHLLIFRDPPGKKAGLEGILKVQRFIGRPALEELHWESRESEQRTGGSPDPQGGGRPRLHYERNLHSSARPLHDSEQDHSQGRNVIFQDLIPWLRALGFDHGNAVTLRTWALPFSNSGTTERRLPDLDAFRNSPLPVPPRITIEHMLFSDRSTPSTGLSMPN